MVSSQQKHCQDFWDSLYLHGTVHRGTEIDGQGKVEAVDVPQDRVADPDPVRSRVGSRGYGQGLIGLSYFLIFILLLKEGQNIFFSTDFQTNLIHKLGERKNSQFFSFDIANRIFLIRIR